MKLQSLPSLKELPESLKCSAIICAVGREVCELHLFTGNPNQELQGNLRQNLKNLSRCSNMVGVTIKIVDLSRRSIESGFW